METYQKDIIFAPDKTKPEMDSEIHAFMEGFLEANNLTGYDLVRFRRTWISGRHVHLEVDVEKIGAGVELN